MTLLALVVRHLESQKLDFGAIGAAALAHHGVNRATHDIDLLCADASVLKADTWGALRDAGADVEIRRGDLDDPLAGVVRIRRGEERPVDLIVGKLAWIRSVLGRASAGEVAGVALPIAQAADLVLLKLYAGGPQDAWDIAELLSGPERDSLEAEVSQRVEELPGPARALWRKLSER